jgi:DNA-binding winged helix-turn-helix (wHTH) protein/tetratricopeptide (TPR) repeat protein
VFEFGEYRLDPARRLLTLRGEPVAITGKPFDALVYLVRNAGTVVTRRALSDALWPTTVVEDNNLSQTVLALRRALGDTQEQPLFVATVPRRGYQFIAPVRETVAAVEAAVAEPFDARLSAARVGARFRGRLALAAVAVFLAVSTAVVGFGWRAGSEGERGSSTGSLAADALYQQALDLYRTHGGIGVSMPRGIRLEIDRRLGEALTARPDFAAALGWRAHVTLDSLLFDPQPAEEWPLQRAALVARVEADATQAIDADATQWMGHVALARLDLYRWRLNDALAKLEHASASGADASPVWHYTAMVHVVQGDFPAAERAARRALELDERNPAPYTPLCIALLAQGRQAEAMAAAKAMIALAPNAPIGYINLARSLSTASDADFAEAVRLAEARLDDSTRNFRVDVALSYARAGAHAQAQRLVAEFEAASAGRRVDPGVAAMARLALRDYVAAREFLERAIVERHDGLDPMPLTLIRLNSWNDAMLEQPEWRELRARLAH